MGHVELVEAGAIAVGFGDLFDGVASCCAESVGEVELSGYFGDGEFAVFVVDFVYADGREADGSGDWEVGLMRVCRWYEGEPTFVTKDGGSGVAEIRIDELSGYDSVTEEGLPWGLSILHREGSYENRTICKMGVGLAGIGGSVVPSTLSQLLFRQFLQFPRLCTQTSIPLSHLIIIKGSKTSIERRHLPLIRLPKVLPLIQRPLRRTPLADVGVLGVRHCRSSINQLSRCM